MKTTGQNAATQTHQGSNNTVTLNGDGCRLEASIQHGPVGDDIHRGISLHDCFTHQHITLNAVQTVALLAWLDQHRTELEQMAQEDMISSEGIASQD